MSNLRIPGPTPLAPQVLRALSFPMISHRGSDYEEIHKRVIQGLKIFFQTSGDIFLITSSGTGGLEAAVTNFFSSGDLLVFLTCGEFGNRWTEIARRYGANVKQIKFEPGHPVDRNIVEKELSEFNNIKGVFITHNETSTGVLNNIEELSKVIKTHPSKPLILVDSVSALGGVDLKMDDWGIDVVVSATQKAWMSPPGIAMMAVSKEAFRRHKTASMPHYYFDISLFAKFALKNQTPATPALTTLYGLDTALIMMRKEGRSQIFKRHFQLRDYFRSQVRKMGLELFVEDKDASPTLTSIIIPDGIEDSAWRGLLRKKYDTVIAGGMGKYKGKIVRVAHMGFCNLKDMDITLTSMKKSLLAMKNI